MKTQPNKKRPPRIVIGDADAGLRRDLTGALEDAGYIVAAAVNDAIHAIQVTKSLDADVALLDADLPRTGGIAAARVLRDQRVAPAVIMASLVTKENIRSANVAGAWAVMAKPVDTTRLLPVIELAIHHW